MSRRATTHQRIGSPWHIIVLLGLVWLASGCTRNPGTPTERGFSHIDHVGTTIATGDGERALACADCHALSAATHWVSQRPGSADHAPCDTCHAADFAAAPGVLCAVCHRTDPLAPGDSTLEPYPPVQARDELVGRFGHTRHLSGEVRIDGRPLACEDCHRVEGPDAAFATFPIHADCVACHTQGRAGAGRVTMDDCGGCHRQGGPGRLRRFARNDVRFTHGKHRADQNGAEIPCQRCHSAVVDSAAGDVLLPGMATCATCHEDPTRTPDRVRISKCGVCHVDDVTSEPLPGNHTAALPGGPIGSGRLGAGAGPMRPIVLAQRPAPGDTASDGVPALGDLLPSVFDIARPAAEAPDGAEARAEDRAPRAPRVSRDPIDRTRTPEGHTLLFRTRHGPAAAAPDAKCHYCHGETSGSIRDSCQDCHAVSRPASHTLHFRNASHGRLAARDPQACATCHEVDFCAACHAVRPASHRGDFSRRHAAVARTNPRACLTCHAFESTCDACHGDIRQPPAARSTPLRRRMSR